MVTEIFKLQIFVCSNYIFLLLSKACFYILYILYYISYHQSLFFSFIIDHCFLHYWGSARSRQRKGYICSIDSLAVMCNALIPQLTIYIQAPQTFPWFTLNASHALVQPIDGMSTPVYPIVPIHFILCRLFILLRVQALISQILFPSILPSPIWYPQSPCSLHFLHILPLCQPRIVYVYT